MKTRIPATLLKLALCTAACFSPAAHTSTLNYGFEDCRVATADELDEMRGGFDLNVGGLHLSFSIDRVTFINGKLVATTSLNIPSLNALLNMPSLNSLGNPQAIIASLQNAFGSSGSTGGASGTGTAGGSTSSAGTGSGGGSTGTASSGGSTAGAGGGSTTTAGAGSGGGTTGSAGSGSTGGGSGTGTAGGSTSSTGTGSGGSTGTASSGGSTTGAGGGSTTTAGTGSGGGTTASAGTGSSYNPSNAVQNGPNNTFTLPDGLNLSTTALNTIIQNSLDNQVIRNMTVLNATLNSQSLIRAMAISSSLNQMLNSSIR